MRPRPEDVPVPAEGYELVDRTFTPWDAFVIVASIPADSYHWTDIPRINPGAVRRYARTMIAGKWRDETVDLGFFDHPIRFNHDGITHGVMRLLACVKAGRPFRAAVYAPVGFLEGLLGDG
jgi:hypothetical protein